tara:strand:- start:1121 stop:1669 length:549 start_codon:yes stop_codon:yes gene_type:complete
MALSSKLETINIRVDHATPASGDWEYKFTINSMVSDIGQVNFNSPFDEAIDGSLRHNLRGFRLNLELNWDKLLSSTAEKRTYTSSWGSFSSSTVSAFLTDLIDSLVTDGDGHVEISFDGTFDAIYNISSPNLSTADHFRFVLDSSTFKTVYTNQIGRSSANLKFVGKQILTGIPAALEAPSV